MGYRVIVDYKCSLCGNVISGNCRVRDGYIVLKCNNCNIDHKHKPAKCYHLFCKKTASFVSYDPNRSGWYKCYCIDCAFDIAKKKAIPPHPYLIAAFCIPLGIFCVSFPIACYLSISIRDEGGWTPMRVFIFILVGIVIFIPGIVAIIRRKKWISDRLSVIAVLDDLSISKGEKLFKYFKVSVNQILHESAFSHLSQKPYPMKGDTFIMNKNNLSVKDFKQQAKNILSQEISSEDKKAKIEALLAALDQDYRTGRKKPVYCQCGYPVRITYSDGSTGPFMDIVDCTQVDPNDPYTHDYKCPNCGNHIQRITQ